MEHVTCPTKNGRDLEESIEHDNFYIILEYHAYYVYNTYTYKFNHIILYLAPQIQIPNSTTSNR